MSNESYLQLTDEQILELPEFLQEEATKRRALAERQAGSEVKEFGDGIYTAIVGQKGTTIGVTRRPADGSKIPKGTYLMTLYRPSTVFDLRHNGGSFFEWLAQFAERHIEAGELDNI
jgi:hypothetical protein